MTILGLPSWSLRFPFFSLVFSFSASSHLSRWGALRCDTDESSSSPGPRLSSSAHGAPFLSGRRRYCCTAVVGASLFPRRRSCSLWPRPPWVFLLKVTTSLFKNSAEKEKMLYPTLCCSFK